MIFGNYILEISARKAGILIFSSLKFLHRNLQTIISSYSLFIEHETVHTDEKMFNCRECSKCFKQRSSLRKHMQDKHLEPNKKHICHICHKNYATVGLRKFLKNTSNDGRKIWALKTDRSLRKHIYTVHAKKSILCAECPKKFTTDASLKNHKPRFNSPLN